MKTRTTKPFAATAPKVPASVDASLLEKLFDQAPDVAFSIKDPAGCYPAVRQFENWNFRKLSVKTSVTEICPRVGDGGPQAPDSSLIGLVSF